MNIELMDSIIQQATKNDISMSGRVRKSASASKKSAKAKKRGGASAKPKAAVSAPAKETSSTKPMTGPQKYNVVIPPARIRRFLDKEGINKRAEDAIAAAIKEYDDIKGYDEIKKKHNEATVTLRKEGKNSPNYAKTSATINDLNEKFKALPGYTEIKDKVMQLQNSRIRFNNDAAVSLSVFLDDIVVETLSGTMLNLVVDGKVVRKILKTEDIVDAVRKGKFNYAKLLAELPTMKSLVYARDLHEYETRCTKPLYTKISTLTRRLNRLAPNSKAAANDADMQKEMASDDETNSDVVSEGEEGTTIVPEKRYQFYIMTLFKNAMASVVKEHGDLYGSFRISEDARKFMSTTLSELLDNIGSIIEVLAPILRIKTINHEIVLTIIDLVLRMASVSESSAITEAITTSVTTRLDAAKN